jgi:hypothetical protein
MVAVAFLTGGPALAGGKSGWKCGGTKKSNCASQQMSAGGCGQGAAGCGSMMKAGCCGQAAAGCGSMMKAGCGQGAAGCGSMMKAGCGQGAAGCGSMMKAGCSQAMGAGGGAGRSCGSMANCSSCSSRTMRVSHDQSNIWYRGPAPRAGMAGRVFDGGRCGRHRAMSCGGKAGCGHAVNSGSKMGRGLTPWKAGAGMTCGTGCPHAAVRTAGKSGCSANTVTPKGGCCAGRGAKS